MSKSKPKSNSITKSGDDNFENSDDEGDINDDDEEKEANEEIPIMTTLVTSLCKSLKKQELLSKWIIFIHLQNCSSN